MPMLGFKGQSSKANQMLPILPVSGPLLCSNKALTLHESSPKELVALPIPQNYMRILCQQYPLVPSNSTLWL